MVSELWPFFYRHAQRQNFWVRLTNRWQNAILQASACITEHCHSISGHILQIWHIDD